MKTIAPLFLVSLLAALSYADEHPNIILIMGDDIASREPGRRWN